MFIAYGCLVIMALVPIVLGAFRSVTHHNEQKASGEKPDTMSHKDAAMFPLIASGALLGFYIFFQIFSKEYINLLLTFYFFFLGILALSHLIRPVMSNLTPENVVLIENHLKLTQKEKEEVSEGLSDLVDCQFTTHDIICLGFFTIVGLWHLFRKHWVIFCIGVSINGVELLHLKRVLTGCILLATLCFYKAFWVVNTSVFLLIHTSLDSPHVSFLTKQHV